MATSVIDRACRTIVGSRFFAKGWGDPVFIQKIIENHQIVSKRLTCKNLTKAIEIKLTNKRVEGKSTVLEGCFISPFSDLLPGSMQENNQLARFQLIIPNKWNSRFKPLVIHYAGTGDHEFGRRKILLANGLIKDGIASLIHMNPFYGARKPDDQRGSNLNYLFDLFVMGGALILEAQVMLQWATKQGFGPLALHGISMGGHMACLGASVYPEPICLIPCLSWTTASHVFTEGTMSYSVAWDVLCQQYYNDDIYSKYIRSLIEPPIPGHLQNNGKVITPVDNVTPKLPSIIEDTALKLTRSFDPVRFLNRNNSNQSNFNDKEVRVFMRDILDYFTHLGNYSVPMDTRLVTAVVAEIDAYIPINGVAHFKDVWDSNCEIEVLKGQGHVEAYLKSSNWADHKFRDAIVRTINRYVELYHNEPGPFGDLKHRSLSKI